MSQAEREEWVFGYGSLMWQPGFPFAEARHARLDGYHRCFCIYSVHYRGSPRRPGLVLGLDRGGTCEGIAFRLAPEDAPAVLAYLRQRELIYGVYREALVSVELIGTGRPPVWARAFIAERAHPAYAGRPSLMRQLALIRGARGEAGPNLDYLINTVSHLRDLAIREPTLERLVTAAGGFAAGGAKGASRLGGRSRGRTVSLAEAWSARSIATARMHRDNRFAHRRALVWRAGRD